MNGRILWLDNDALQVEPYGDALRARGFDVRVVTTLLEAEEALAGAEWDLLILDVMIPTWSEEEEESYPPDRTDSGYASGIEFYRRNRPAIAALSAGVFVMSVRLDAELYDALRQAGLPEGRFATKLSLRDASNFVQRIEELFLTKES